MPRLVLAGSYVCLGVVVVTIGDLPTDAGAVVAVALAVYATAAAGLGRPWSFVAALGPWAFFFSYLEGVEATGLDCKQSCGSPAWVVFVVVGGACFLVIVMGPVAAIVRRLRRH
jgi:hypothetical protein